MFWALRVKGENKTIYISWNGKPSLNSFDLNGDEIISLGNSKQRNQKPPYPNREKVMIK